MCWRRGGLILYRTVIKGAALQGTAVLDISEPVRDYARVSALSAAAREECKTACYMAHSHRSPVLVYC